MQQLTCVVTTPDMSRKVPPLPTICSLCTGLRMRASRRKPEPVLSLELTMPSCGSSQRLLW
ncbi:hypothetical protein FIBSPDRAFT_322939 [Athelia psychrophila]|uniref:Uncharacterized protein n=1 Tax=Athelia psychrophila TaxID=1759441 RepID=A0A167WQU7_9AGAM|nr:hypothetical protein FIBSPDRAFT_322939 [Fibularhizoctonia sp. CBS 109695]